MSDNELTAKLAFILAVVIGTIALGYVIVFAVAPFFVAATVIDFGFRNSYNAKFAAIQGSDELDQGPGITAFEARVIHGRVAVGWLVDLPGDAHLDIYRVTGSGGGSIDEIVGRGTCVYSTGREYTDATSEGFYDDGLPHGTYYYVPVVSGMRIKREPVSYSFLSFARELHYITRKTRVAVRGEAVRVDLASPEPVALPDGRDEAARLADEVLEQFQARKKFDAELDAAISRIRGSHELSEEEKAEAIELMETRAASI